MIYEVSKNWNECQGHNSFLFHILLVWTLSNYQNEMLTQCFPNVTVACNYLCETWNASLSYTADKKLQKIIEHYTHGSHMSVYWKSHSWFIFASYITSIATNLIFRDIYSNPKYFQCFSLIAKFRYKYLWSNVSYELCHVKVLIY